MFPRIGQESCFIYIYIIPFESIRRNKRKRQKTHCCSKLWNYFLITENTTACAINRVSPKFPHSNISITSSLHQNVLYICFSPVSTPTLWSSSSIIIVSPLGETQKILYKKTHKWMNGYQKGHYSRIWSSIWSSNHPSRFFGYFPFFSFAYLGCLFIDNLLFKETVSVFNFGVCFWLLLSANQIMT